MEEGLVRVVFTSGGAVIPISAGGARLMANFSRSNTILKKCQEGRLVPQTLKWVLLQINGFDFK